MSEADVAARARSDDFFAEENEADRKRVIRGLLLVEVSDDLVDRRTMGLDVRQRAMGRRVGKELRKLDTTGVCDSIKPCSDHN